MISKTKQYNALMILLVFIWGMEYVAAKISQTVFETMTIVTIKYCLAIFVIGAAKLITKSHSLLHKKDIPVFFLCALLGQVLYFSCEYKAMDYIPVGLITILLSFIPIFSIITERILYKKEPTRKMMVGILVCIVGVVLIIGVDFADIRSGQFLGYLLSFGAAFCWNAYNFVTERIAERYDPPTLLFNQMICTLLLIAPIGISQFPGFSAFDTPVIVCAALFQGLMCSGCGFLMYVFALSKLGPTTMAIYNNFLPVTTVLLGWMLLGETLTLLQIAGMIIVIAAGFMVIAEKAKG